MQGIAPQNRHINTLTEEFLSVHWDRQSPLLLGYSGGGDSKALLFALLEAGVKNVHLAHVDHGWRIESREEAALLQEEAAELGCPFHSIRLSPPEKNKEDAARKARLAFFSSLFSQVPFQALLLAHHADDLAETVLKRIFEGAHLASLTGMEKKSFLQGMPVWRPLLDARRSEIFAFLKQRDLSFLSDSTNEDPSFLRSRMRKVMLPYLVELFGKEIVGNLTLLSERAAELKHYLDEKTEKVPIRKGPWGAFLEMGTLTRIEKRHLFQKVMRQENITLSRAALEQLLDWSADRDGCRCLEIKEGKVWVDRGLLFWNLSR